MALVKRSEPLPKEEAEKWAIGVEEELEIDETALTRTIELMPQKMGLTLDELFVQEANQPLGKEGPEDKPGITFEELITRVEPFKQPEVSEMPTLYWLFTSQLYGGWAQEALRDEPELAKDVVKFTGIFSRELAREIKTRGLRPNYFAIVPYALVPKNHRPRLLRLPTEKPEASAEELAFIPSNPLVAIGLRGLWSGGPDWQRKRVWHHNEEQQTAHIVHRLKKGGNIRLEVAPTAGTLPAVQAFTALDKYLSSLSAFTSDIALLVLAALGKAKNPMIEPVIVSAAYIRQAKGDELYGRQREKFDARVAEEMENLKRLNFSIAAVEVKDPETKRWRAMSWGDDHLFNIVTIEEHQGGLYGKGKSTPVAWTVRAGQWAYWFLNPQARHWVAGIAGELFALSHRDDRRAEQLAKKIGQFVTLQGWKTGKGQPLRWKRKTLLELVGENIEVESKPARLVDALEAALTVLKDHGIFHDIRSDEFTRKQTRGWISNYLSGTIEFIPTPRHAEIKANAVTERKAKKLKVAANLGDKIKQARENQDLNQAALARHLKISRQYLSEIENGKREPSAKVLKTIKTWLEAE